MTNYISAEVLIEHLTPADEGIIQAVLDDCIPLSDDATVDGLTAIIINEDIATGRLAEDLACLVVHNMKRRLV